MRASTFFDTADVYSVGQSEEITGHWGVPAKLDDTSSDQGTVHGGHLVEARINPVANLFVTEYDSPKTEK
jgi:hypothetical protein